MDHYGMAVETMWSDDGIVFRLPESADELPVAEILVDPDEIDELVLGALPSTSLFSSRFRECAARALLLPRRRPDSRTPLWQQRQRAADLLAVAAKYPTFPILLEASRECLQDVFDVPALRTVLADLRSRKIRLVTVDTQKASPFAQSLLFSWIATYMYEGDAPLAERRAAALALDRDLLRELLGAEELRELIDAGVLADLELDLQSLSDHRRARSADEVHDLLRRLGDLSLAEIDLRSAEPGAAADWAASLVERAARHRAADRRRGAPRGRRGRGALPRRPRRARCPSACRRRSPSPSSGRSSSSSPASPAPTGPSRPAPVARRFATPVERVVGALRALEAEGRVVLGEFRPDGVEREWCDTEVLRQLRRRSLASLRKEVEPVEPAALARFLPAWQGVGSGRRGLEALVEALGVLQGAAIPASTLDLDVLPAPRPGLPARRPRRAVHLGRSGLDGRRRLGAERREGAAVLPRPGRRCWPGRPTSTTDRAASCTTRCGSTSGVAAPASGPTCCAAAPGATDVELLTALWDLVWAGEVTNDSLAPLRSFVSGATAKRAGGAARAARSRPRPGRLTRLGPPSGAGRWSLVAPLLEPAPSTDRGRSTPRACSCSSATAC